MFYVNACKISCFKITFLCIIDRSWKVTGSRKEDFIIAIIYLRNTILISQIKFQFIGIKLTLKKLKQYMNLENNVCVKSLVLTFEH